MKNQLKRFILASILMLGFTTITNSVFAATASYSVDFVQNFVSGHTNGIYYTLSGNTSLSARHYIYSQGSTSPFDYARNYSIELKYKCGIANLGTCTHAAKKPFGSAYIQRGEWYGPNGSSFVSWPNLPKKTTYYFVVYQTESGNLDVRTSGTGTVTTK